MTKDLTSKMHLKQKLFMHRLPEGGNILNHISEFKEIVSDQVQWRLSMMRKILF